MVNAKYSEHFDCDLSEDIKHKSAHALSEELFGLLKNNGLKISVAESFTAGRVISDIIKNPGASSVVYEGIVCYSNESKADRLGVKWRDIQQNGAVSFSVAKEMAEGLLEKEGCNLSVSTTGIAGPMSDDSLKPVGLCYIGVADKYHTDVFELRLKGDREEVTEQAVRFALWLAIEKIKQK